MSWIKSYAEQYAEMKADRAHRESTINLMNYWANLRQQIQSDVAEINHTEAWADQVGRHPIAITDVPDGFLIEKNQSPHVGIYLYNRGKEVEMRVFHITGKGEERDRRDIFKVVEQGRHIILRLHDENFIVPEMASERILEPIMQALLDSVEM